MSLVPANSPTARQAEGYLGTRTRYLGSNDTGNAAAVLAALNQMTSFDRREELMDDRELQSWIELRACVRQLAVTIRTIETDHPGYYGAHGDVVRRYAAGDDMSLDELLTTIVALQASAP